MHLGMDGPNVNKAFEGKLLNCFKEDNGTEFLKLGHVRYIRYIMHFVQG